MIDTLPFARLINQYKSDEEPAAYGIVPEVLLLIVLVASVVYGPIVLSGYLSYMALILWFFAAYLLFALALSNLKTMELLDKLTMPLTIVAIAYQIVNSLIHNDVGVFWSALLGGLIVGGLPWLLYQLSKGESIGGGDVKLAFAAGILLGWKLGLISLILFLILIVASALIIKIMIAPRRGNTQIGTGDIWLLSISACFIFGHLLLG